MDNDIIGMVAFFVMLVMFGLIISFAVHSDNKIWADHCGAKAKTAIEFKECMTTSRR